MNFSSIQGILDSGWNYIDHHMLRSLTAQQKKVVVVVSTIFGLLATACCVYRCCFRAKKIDSDKGNLKVNPLQQKNEKNKEASDIQKDEKESLIEQKKIDSAKIDSPSKVPAESSLLDATIPVVDMTDFQNNDPIKRQKFIDGLAKALKEVGFVAVLNPGVDQQALNDAYQTAEKFFKLPIKDKMALHDPATNGQRGYVAGESAKGEKVGDFKEFYHIGREMTEEQEKRLKYYPNIWPKDMELQKPMVALFQALQAHMVPLQQAMASAIGQPEDFFTNMTEEGDLLLRAIHYPANPPKDHKWAAEHTDIDLFTILPRATAEGLQLKNKEGEWIDVKVPENAFIINAGDMLENITNGEFRSGLHRVVASTENKERYSMVLFIHPRSDDCLNPLPQCIERAGGVKKYADATRWELLEERLVDLGLASPEMIEHLGKSGLMERLIQVGRASQKAMGKLVEAGVASDAVIQEWNKNKQKE